MGETMRLKPFLDFHRSAESAGYPALLIASMVCLGLVVAPVGLLAMTRAAWALGLTLLSLIGAVALLAAAVTAAFADAGEPVYSPEDAVDAEPEPIATLTQRGSAARARADDRRAA
jgi:hypothetical protein